MLKKQTINFIFKSTDFTYAIIIKQYTLSKTVQIATGFKSKH